MMPLLVFLMGCLLIGMGLYLIACTVLVLLAGLVLKWLIENFDEDAFKRLLIVGSVVAVGYLILTAIAVVFEFVTSNPGSVVTAFVWLGVLVGGVLLVWLGVRCLGVVADRVDAWERRRQEHRGFERELRRIEQAMYDGAKSEAIASKAHWVSEAERKYGKEVVTTEVQQAINDSLVRNLRRDVLIVAEAVAICRSEAQKAFLNRNLSDEQRRRIYAECLRRRRA